VLYITTRDHKDACTSYHALSTDRGSCGGLYVPFQLHRFTPEEIASFRDQSFSQCIANILNIFFSTRLDQKDVECCMGIHPLKLVPMSHKITIAEVWNNPDWSFTRFVRNLSGRMLGSADRGKPCNWTWIAVRIAVLFGIFSNLAEQETVKPIDVSVCCGDFSAPMAAWYAREMGIPIGKIIFSCNENSSAWELLHHGQVNMDETVVATLTPACDIKLPLDAERLIHAVLGEDEAVAFGSKVSSGGIYILEEDKRKALSKGFFGAVIGRDRTEAIIRNVYRTSTYLLGPYSALAYGGLQDYRATHGEANPALIITEDGPLCARETVAKVLGITRESL